MKHLEDSNVILTEEQELENKRLDNILKNLETQLSPSIDINIKINNMLNNLDYPTENKKFNILLRDKFCETMFQKLENYLKELNNLTDNTELNNILDNYVKEAYSYLNEAKKQYKSNLTILESLFKQIGGQYPLMMYEMMHVGVPSELRMIYFKKWENMLGMGRQLANSDDSTGKFIKNLQYPTWDIQIDNALKELLPQSILLKQFKSLSNTQGINMLEKFEKLLWDPIFCRINYSIL